MLITNIDDARKAIENQQVDILYLYQRVRRLESWSWERRIWSFLSSIPYRIWSLFGR